MTGDSSPSPQKLRFFMSVCVPVHVCVCMCVCVSPSSCTSVVEIRKSYYGHTIIKIRLRCIVSM